MQNRREIENIQWLLGHIYRDLKAVASSTRGSRTTTKDSLFATQDLMERLITMTAELCNVVARLNDQLEDLEKAKHAIELAIADIERGMK